MENIVQYCNIYSVYMILIVEYCSVLQYIFSVCGMDGGVLFSIAVCIQCV